MRKTFGRSKRNEKYITDRLDNLLRKRPSPGIVIAGDFNHLNPHEICQRLSLCKLVRASTRGNNILDQILTDTSQSKNTASPTRGRSDHHCHFSRAGAKRRARVLNPLGTLLHPGILTNIAESKVDVQWSRLLCACVRFERVKTQFS